jgi:hypothetical protein
MLEEENAGEEECLYTIGGYVNSITPMEKQYKDSSKTYK